VNASPGPVITVMPLLAYVTGPAHQDVYAWWVAIHHNIGLGGAPMNMTMSPGAGT
jgi:hypothetical protein